MDWELIHRNIPDLLHGSLCTDVAHHTYWYIFSDQAGLV
jgi:hypothetical protein